MSKNTTSPAIMLTRAERVLLVQEAVCRHHGIELAEMFSRTKIKRCVQPRQIAMALVIDLLGYSSSFVAFAFKRDDHGTVLHAAKAVKRWIDTDEAFAGEYHELCKQIRIALNTEPLPGRGEAGGLKSKTGF